MSDFKDIHGKHNRSEVSHKETYPDIERSIFSPQFNGVRIAVFLREFTRATFESIGLNCAVTQLSVVFIGLAYLCFFKVLALHFSVFQVTQRGHRFEKLGLLWLNFIRIIFLFFSLKQLHVNEITRRHAQFKGKQKQNKQLQVKHSVFLEFSDRALLRQFKPSIPRLIEV